MATLLDRLLLFVYSFIVGIALIILLIMTFNWIDYEHAIKYLDNLYHEPIVAYPFIGCAALFLLISVRLFYIAIRRSSTRLPSIDRRTDYGDVKISIDTIQSLALKSAGSIRGLSQIKSRIRMVEAGLEIDLRAAVNGEASIPGLSEEAQRTVKFHIEEMTGIPVSNVTVYVSNVAPPSSPTFKSRVE